MKIRMRHHKFIIGGFLLIISLLAGCDYARMTEDEAIRTYERSLPKMPSNAVPVRGGLDALRIADPDTLKNPLPSTPGIIARGAERYGFYCSQCHGPDGDGFGTVGQSFAPLPTSLTGEYVQNQSDGMIFVLTSLGFKRHPPLFDTVTPGDRWAIIHFLRDLAARSG